MRESVAENIVYDLFKDMRSRRGFAQLLDELDEDIVDEMIADWVEIVISSDNVG